MKKHWFYGDTVCLVALVVLQGIWSHSRGQEASTQKKTSTRINVLLYRGGDTSISALYMVLEKQAEGYEQGTGIKVALDIMDIKSSQNTQGSQVERLVSLGYNALCVNIVDRPAASIIIDEAVAVGIPVVFFNREPVEEGMNRWEKLYYMGADAKEPAVLQRQILVNAYRKNPETPDTNGDNMVSYTLLEGGTNHQDSLIRTEWSIQTLKDGSIPLEKIAGRIANWERSQVSALMDQRLDECPGQIEPVIYNNDDMALGAIDAMERERIMGNSIRLVGIDGTPVDQEALEEGKLFGTVESDKQKYTGVAFDIASSLAMGKDVKDGVGLGGSKYCWCPQIASAEQRQGIWVGMFCAI